MIGTTKRGIGPCYASKAIRNGIRVGDLRHLDSFREKLDILYRDAAARFKDFEYSLALVDAEMEYIKYAERLEPHCGHYGLREQCVLRRKADPD